MKLFDRVWETSTTTGTDPYTLAGAKDDFRAFGDVLSDDDWTEYFVVDPSDQSTWERCKGQYDSANDQLSRTLIESSTGSLIDWGTGTRDIYMAPRAKSTNDETPVVRATSRPSWLPANSLWIDTDADPVALNWYDGTDDSVVGTIGDSGFTPYLEGSAITAPPDPPVVVGENVLCPHEGLVVKQVTAATVDIDATALLLRTAAGVGFRATSVDLTVDITASGANGLDTGTEANSTWYHLWVISNGTTTASLMSLSATAPTLPSGYTYKGYVGAVYNDSGGDLLGFLQFGTVALASTGAAPLLNGTAGTYTAVSLAAHVPATATHARLRVEVNSSSGTNTVQVNVAPAGTGSSAPYGNLSHFGSFGTTGTPVSDVRCPLSTAQQIVYLVGGTNARADIQVQGWEF